METVPINDQRSTITIFAVHFLPRIVFPRIQFETTLETHSRSHEPTTEGYQINYQHRHTHTPIIDKKKYNAFEYKYLLLEIEEMTSARARESVNHVLLSRETAQHWNLLAVRLFRNAFYFTRDCRTRCFRVLVLFLLCVELVYAIVCLLLHAIYGVHTDWECGLGPMWLLLCCRLIVHDDTNTISLQTSSTWSCFEAFLHMNTAHGLPTLHSSL